MVFNDIDRAELEDASADLFLAGDGEPANGLVLLAYLHDVFLELRDLLVHLSGDVAHVAAFLRKKVYLLLAVQNVALEADVLHALALESFGDLLQHVKIVSGILLNFFGENIQVQNALRERVQKVGVVGDDDAGFLGIDQKLCKMFDARLVEIVRRLVEQEHVRILNDRVRKEQSRLLATGKAFDDPVERRDEVHHVEHFFDARFDVVDFFARKCAGKKFQNGGVELVAGDDLLGDRLCKTVLHDDIALLGGEIAHDQVGTSCSCRRRSVP